MSKQTLSFQAEVAQLLHLVTHSLYSNQEIFLRELISNASDACDKLRFEGLNNAALFEDAPNLEVRVTFDKAAKTLTITDTGIGMSQQDAIDHLGTIAKSGTKDVMGKLMWSEYLAMTCLSFQALRDSSASSRRCRMMLVPRCARVIVSTSKSPVPPLVQRTPSSGLRPARRDSTVILSATMKPE